MNEDFLSVGELAGILKVRKSWVYGKTMQTGAGTIPRLKVGKYLRFNLKDVMGWMERQNQEN